MIIGGNNAHRRVEGLEKCDPERVRRAQMRLIIDSIRRDRIYWQDVLARGEDYFVKNVTAFTECLTRDDARKMFAKLVRSAKAINQQAGR